MNQQTSIEGTRSRQSAKRRFALALATGLISCPGLVIYGLAQGQDGVRELRKPSEMQKVAPVRAVGIRLSPALPMDLNKTNESKEPLPIPQPTPQSKVANETSSASTPVDTSVPPIASSSAASSAPASTKNKAPERIIPKSKISGAGSEKNSARTPLIKAQAPIQIRLGSSEEIRTVSAPTSSTKEPSVSGLVATEAKVMTNEKSDLDLPPPPAVIAPLPTLRSDSAIDSSPPAPELEHAVQVNVDSQSTQEIPIDFPIRNVIVRDESICRAMSSNGCVFIVGLSTGESIVEVKSADDRPSRYLRVKVASPWQRTSSTADLEQLSHAIQPLSPNGVVSVRALDDGSIVVQGKVESKETAKRIMELTRKLILVPVVDKLEIR